MQFSLSKLGGALMNSWQELITPPPLYEKYMIYYL